MEIVLRGDPQEMAAFFKEMAAKESTFVAATEQPEEIAETPRSESTVVAEQPETKAKAKTTTKLDLPHRIGFVAGDDTIRAPMKSEEQLDFPEGGAEIERQIMGFLVENKQAELGQIAIHIGLSRPQTSEKLARMEKLRWVKSEPEGERLYFRPLPIKRKYQVNAVVGTERTRLIEQIIRDHPGSTNRDIGCRILVSTEDVASRTSSMMASGTLRREGAGPPDEPYRYFFKEQTTATQDEAEVEGHPS